MEEVTRLVSSGDCVKIWDSASMLVLDQFNPHCAGHPVAQVCWSSNNQYLVSASSLGDKLVVSSLKSSAQPVLELAEGSQQTRVSLNSSSQYLVSGGLDNSVNIWDLKTKRLHRSLKEEHKEEVTCVSFNSNDSYIASGSTSGDIILHSVTTNMSSKAFGHGANQPIHDLKYSVVKRSLLGSVSDSGSVVLWDSNTQKELHAFDSAHKAPASGLAFSPTNDLLFVTVGLDKKIVCYDTASKIVLRSVRVESPLTAIDFSPDGTGLAVGSTQGRVYLYDLRNLNAPTRTAAAHKTSVTCLRFQSSPRGHVKSSKAVSSRTSGTHPSRRISTKLGSNPLPAPASVTTPTSTAASPVPYPGERGDGQGQTPGAGAKVEAFSREAEGHHGGDRLPSLDKFTAVGRNSMDIFSPVREDYKGHGMGTDVVGGLRGNGSSSSSGADMFSREAEGGPHGADKFSKAGRNSLDIFSPVREDYRGPGVSAEALSGKRGSDLEFQSSFSGGPPHRKTPLGTPGGRCYSPLAVFQTTPPITEEEAPPPADLTREDKTSGSSVEGGGQTPPSSSAQTSQSHTAGFFTPEPGLRRANDTQAQLRYDTPVNGAPPTKAQGPAAAAASSLSERIMETVGAEGGGAPLTALQVQFIRNMIHETLEDFRDACHRDIVNLQVEMIRQFYIQLNEIHGLIEKYSVNDSLMDEIEKLKEENNRLRANY